MSSHHGRGLKLHLHPYVYAYVTHGWIASLAGKWRREYGVKVMENQALGMLEMRFYNEKGDILQHTEEHAPAKAEK